MSGQTDLPHRGVSKSSSSAIPDEDPSQVTKLFLERLEAWRHAAVYLEDYISATEKVHKAHAKEYEKVLKTLSNPLKERQQFDAGLGGVAGMFESIKANTQGIAHIHAETEKVLKDSVLPIISKLQSEIEHKIKDISKGAAKESKHIEKARNESQTYIELLGQHVVNHDVPGRKVDPSTDPYVIQRQLYYRLNKQINEENSNLQELLEVQNTFQRFEAHAVDTMQRVMTAFVRAVGTQAERTSAMYSDMARTSQGIPLDFEWKRFVQRHASVLIDPDSPTRSIEKVHFPHRNHPSTQPLVAGHLARKGRLIKHYNTNYCVATPTKYMHEFKDNDNLHSDPSPELSLYLPDCSIGQCNGPKFIVKGKDVHKGKVGTALATRHDYEFKASSPEEALRWWKVIREMAEGDETMPESSPMNSEPSSPVDVVKSTPAAAAVVGGAPVGTAGTGNVGVVQSARAPSQEYPPVYVEKHGP
ncbi:MAG: hypothetical protein M1816_007472 [Peltula sp. TS41687]|nr:MAG: hypothetical protein M1816_007472 [Peltula sp. TS41687]